MLIPSIYGFDLNKKFYLCYIKYKAKNEKNYRNKFNSHEFRFPVKRADYKQAYFRVYLLHSV